LNERAEANVSTAAWARPLLLFVIASGCLSPLQHGDALAVPM